MEHQHHTTSPEVTVHHHPAEGTKRIWKTFWVLLIITIIELGLGLLMYATSFPPFINIVIKGVIIILSLAKAFYIVSIFMHLGDELRNMIMTIVVPLLLFVWFIGAFLWDGDSYKNLRNTYDPHHKEQTTKPAAKPAAAPHDAQKPGEHN
ncbi:MAG TPA: cytochrome C oxidase subunit IV family protein [Chitinophagaceae bacterium]